VGTEACTISKVIFFEKEYTFTNTQLRKKVNIYLAPPLGHWKGARASEGHCILSFISFTVNSPPPPHAGNKTVTKEDSNTISIPYLKKLKFSGSYVKLVKNLVVYLHQP